MQNPRSLGLLQELLLLYFPLVSGKLRKDTPLGFRVREPRVCRSVEIRPFAQMKCRFQFPEAIIWIAKGIGNVPGFGQPGAPKSKAFSLKGESYEASNRRRAEKRTPCAPLSAQASTNTQRPKTPKATNQHIVNPKA